MTFNKTTPAKLKNLFAEAEANKAFLASKKDPNKTISSVAQDMIDELDAEIFELQNQEGTAVSFAVIFIKDTQLVIGPIYVAVAYQGQGYSRDLLKYILELARAKNLDSIFTKTWGANKASRHLFTSHGFTQSKEVLNDRVDGDSTVSYIYQLRYTINVSF